MLSSPSSILSTTEIAMLVCGVVFFVAFFCAVFSEVRVDRPLHRVISYLLSQNVHWRIEPYSRELDYGLSAGNSAGAHGKDNSPA